MISPFQSSILVLDETPDGGSLVVETLIQSGYSVYSAANIDSALGYLSSSCIDLIVVNGILNQNHKSICAAIKVYPVYAGIPIVCAIENANEDTFSELELLGVTDFVRMPIVKKELVFRIESVLRLAHSESKYEAICSNATVGILIHLQGIVRYANQQAVNLIGATSHSQLLGKSIVSFLPVNQKKVFIERLAQQGVLMCTESVEYDVLRVDKKEISVSVKESEINYNGSRAVLAFISDITEKKQISHRLEQQLILHKTLVDSIPLPVYFTNRELAYTGFNTAFKQLFGDKLASNLLFKRKSLFSPRNNIKEELLDKEIMEKGTQVEYESALPICQKGVRNVVVRKTAYCANSGKPLGLIGVLADITDQKNVEKELRETIKKAAASEGQLRELLSEKDKFFSIIAHDLRSPMNGFLGLSKLLSERFYSLPPEMVHKYTVEIAKSASVLYDLIENLLEWSCIQRNAISFQPETVCIASILSETLDLLAISINNKEIQIHNKVNTDIMLQGDYTMIKSLFRNLIINAIKFSYRKGNIIVQSSYSANSTVTISIVDKGVGISQEKQAKLFKITEKISTLGTEGEPSSGLGLILCKDIVDRHKGSIWVESQPNVGTTFFVQFPCISHS